MLTDKASLGGFIVNPRKLEAAIPGSSDGTTVPENVIAIAKVYPTFPTGTIHTFLGNDLIEGLLIGAKGLVCNGYYNRLPTYYSRWDPTFAAQKLAGHCVYVQIEGPKGVRRWTVRDGKFVWWMDPLAIAGYPGEWMALATFLAFVNVNVQAYASEGSVVSAGPEEPLDMIYSIGGTKTALFFGPYSHEPGGPAVGTIKTPTRFLIAAYDQTGKYVAINGLYAATTQLTVPVPMGWVTAGSASAVEDLQTGVDCTAEIAAAIVADRQKARIVYS
jgi:hypothetical protein